MMYADYEYYTSQYMGTVKESMFTTAAIRASAFLDYYTMGKAKKNADSDALKMACCALVDKYAALEELSEASRVTEAGKKSESVGSYSVTYQTKDEILALQKALKEELPETARMYLAGTDMLYRGGCSHVCSAHRNRL